MYSRNVRILFTMITHKDFQSKPIRPPDNRTENICRHRNNKLLCFGPTSYYIAVT
jgi:hypothetical protein